MADHSCNAREEKKNANGKTIPGHSRGKERAWNRLELCKTFFSFSFFFFFFFFEGMKEDGRTTENQFNIASYTLQTTHTENEKYLGGVATSYFMLFLWPMRVLNLEEKKTQIFLLHRQQEKKKGPVVTVSLRRERNNNNIQALHIFPFFSLSPKSEECVSLGREW